MESKRTKGIYGFLLACVCLAMLLSTATYATTSLLPWEGPDSVRAFRALLTQQDGQNVSCTGTIYKIAGRNNPAFFVLGDQFSASDNSKVIVFGRLPFTLRCGETISVEGTLGTIPASGERCIYDATAYGFFNAEGKIVDWMILPFANLPPWISKQALEVPNGPIPPSDPSLADDGMGLPWPVMIDSTVGISKFDTIASLLATAPPLFSYIETACKPVVGVGEDYILVGDDSTDAVVKVYTRASSSIKQGDRIVKLTGTAHSEDGNLVL